MKVVMKYTRKDFWGNEEYIEATKVDADRTDLLKALRELKKSCEYAVQVNNTVITWDSYSDWENKIATVIEWGQGMYHEDSKMTFDEIKKYITKKGHLI